MRNDSAVFAIDAHNPKFPRLVGGIDRIGDCFKSNLQIHPRHGAVNVVLNLIKRSTVYHAVRVSTTCGIINCDMRRSFKGRTVGFHSTDGGSIPTSAHQYVNGGGDA